MSDDPVILSCFPHRTASHEVADDGRVVVLQPRFAFGPLQKLMVRWNRPFVRVRLDEVGSFIWLRAEGDSDLETIASALQQQFGDRVPNARVRTVAFARSLVRARLLQLRTRN
jgi:hypothetical protein